MFHFSSCISKQTLSLTLLTYSPLSLFLSRPTLPVPLQHTLSFAAVHSLSLSLSRPTLSLSLSPLSCPIFTLSCPTLTLSFAPLSPSSLSLAPLSVSSYSHTLLPTSLSISSHSYSLVPLSLSISRPTLTSLSLIPLSSLSYSPYSLSLTPLSFLSFTPLFFYRSTLSPVSLFIFISPTLPSHSTRTVGLLKIGKKFKRWRDWDKRKSALLIQLLTDLPLTHFLFQRKKTTHQRILLIKPQISKFMHVN